MRGVESVMVEAKSSKQRRAELKDERKAKKARVARRLRADLELLRIPRRSSPGVAEVNVDALARDGSYSVPDYVTRGIYEERPFTCQDCGKEEVWTATQQKWWYEVAKGGRWTQATRCRPCRRKERERKAEARRVAEEGRNRKTQARG